MRASDVFWNIVLVIVAITVGIILFDGSAWEYMVIFLTVNSFILIFLGITHKERNPPFLFPFTLVSFLGIFFILHELINSNINMIWVKRVIYFVKLPIIKFNDFINRKFDKPE